MNRFNLRWPVVFQITALFLAMLTLGALPALAQGTSGTIVGTVTDPQGAVIPGATITVTDLSTKQARSTVTNQTGQYVLPDVPPGDYSLTSSKSGFSEDQIPSITVAVGNQTTANFKMTVGAENTIISVEASNADLQTLNATTGQTVEPVIVESLPAIGRDVASFLTMQPGVTPGGMTAGTTADQTTFQLDGGSNSSDMDGTYTGYTSGNTNSTTGGAIAGGPAGVVPMPQDSIEEFKVNTTGQTADFNNSSGSQSQIVTKRGRDQYHGTVYEYYLDNNFNANTWQNNFPGTGYTPKPSYHYSRFGVAGGGPLISKPYLGGKTYIFANYEGFRYPLAATYERAVPSYNFLQQGELGFGGVTFTSAQVKQYDPRGIGMNSVLQNYYNTELPVAPSSGAGSTGATGATYAGTFDTSCGALSGAICDSVNVIGYRANVLTPQSSNFFVTRVDHDFGDKWHLMTSYRYYNLQNVTSNQVDIGGVLSGDKMGVPTAVTPRPQQPWFLVIGLTTNISSSLTNDFHYSYLRNFWQWKGAGAPAQVTGASGAIEPLGESTTNVLSPYNVNAQNIRTRIWDGKDNFFSDNLSKLHGDHFFQVGGSYMHNWNYHQRTDNGASINYTPTYILGDGSSGYITYNGTYSASATSTCNTTTGAGLACLQTTGTTATADQRIYDAFYGIVTTTQVANTYNNVNGTLTQNAPYVAIGAHTTIPYYNIYGTDTWHLRPSLTLNYGISYAIEMPPTESNGNQVMFTDIAGNPISLQQWLTTRQNAASAGQVYNPEIGFALIHNALGAPKYPYNPYYGSVSPRISFAWNPKFKNANLSKLFGDGATVIRGGYGRIYGRINGDVEVLNPLLSPGLILATSCKTVTTANSCTSGTTDSTVYRFGKDGLAPTLASAPPPTTLPQPYHPGFDGPGVSIASPLDQSLRPNDVDTFNLSVQRQLNRRMLVEVGYIGRLIHHEYIMKNPNVVPYMMSQGGQTFEAAYLAIEQAFGCTTSASLCSTSTTPTAATLPAQPFFEAALSGSSYCTGYANCTAAVVAKQASKFRAQQVFSLWQALDSLNTNGVGGTGGFVFGRSMMGTATSNTTYGSAGQVITGLSIGTADGWSNYHGGYVSFKASNWHGLTAQENLTFSKALGLGAYNQSTSSEAAEDSFNLHEQYGVQSFNQKVIFNTFIVYSEPFFKDQAGWMGRLAGGWTLAPVLSAGTGQPLNCVTNNSGQNFGGEDGSTFTDTENCIFTTSYNGGYHTHRNIPGSTDPYGIKVGTNTKGTGPAAVNMFTNPAAVFDSVRPPILGLDVRDGGAGSINGLGYLNLDLSVKKSVRVWEKANLEFSGTFLNFMNHNVFANPSLSLQSTTNWGTTKTQVSSSAPREIQMGVRASF